MISIFALVISEVIVQEHVYNVLKQSVDIFLESALYMPPSTIMHIALQQVWLIRL